jgi:hypothetical protein
MGALTEDKTASATSLAGVVLSFMLRATLSDADVGESDKFQCLTPMEVQLVTNTMVEWTIAIGDMPGGCGLIVPCMDALQCALCIIVNILTQIILGRIQSSLDPNVP